MFRFRHLYFRPVKGGGGGDSVFLKEGLIFRRSIILWQNNLVCFQAIKLLLFTIYIVIVGTRELPTILSYCK